MEKDELLQKAMADGIITEEQRARLETIALQNTGDNEERLKPVGTFNEIFVTIGVMILMSAISGLLGIVIANVVVKSAASAFFLIMCAESFHTRKRFRLPIIYCALAAAGSLAGAVMLGLGNDVNQLFSRDNDPYVWISALAVAMATLAAFSWRYVLPFLMLPISIAFAVLTTIAAKAGENDLSYKLVLGVAGLAILAFAIRCDLKDRFRTSRISDYAFWSYMIGSPLFVHSLFLSVLLSENNDWIIKSSFAWLATFVLVLSVTFAGLLLNRRALIISTLIYVAYIIGRALAGIFTDSAVLIGLVTLLCIGIYVVILGSRWREIRVKMINRLPQWNWLDKLPVR